MNQIVYKQFELIHEEKKKKLNLNPSLGSIIKRIKLKHNNVIVNMMLNFTIKNIIV